MFGALRTEGCPCGKEHAFTSKVIIERNAIERLPALLEEMNVQSAFIFADKNTYSAVEKRMVSAFNESDILTKRFVFESECIEPDETNVGLAIMKFDPMCDVVIGIGSGVINDICKIVANVSKKRYIIVGTAPSMDGYASSTSSMTLEGLKISLNSKCADVIIGDLDVLCNAPMKLLLSGLGDMIAKYVSICDWRISRLITGEYYCEEIAELVRGALKKCMDNAEGLLKRDENAVRAVFEGLVICGAAMKFSGVSRPASGVEHYISHVWDMRGVAFGSPVELHGIQCALGTLKAIKLYEVLKSLSPNKEKALKYVNAFDYGAWREELRAFLGRGAESMISLEEKEGKYDVRKHAQRLEIIIDNWEEIKRIMNEELPDYEHLESVFTRLGLPTKMEDIDLDENIFPKTFKCTKDIRDKYVLSRLCWDLGICDELL